MSWTILSCMSFEKVLLFLSQMLLTILTNDFIEVFWLWFCKGFVWVVMLLILLSMTFVLLRSISYTVLSVALQRFGLSITLSVTLYLSIGAIGRF